MRTFEPFLIVIFVMVAGITFVSLRELAISNWIAITTGLIAGGVAVWHFKDKRGL